MRGHLLGMPRRLDATLVDEDGAVTEFPDGVEVVGDEHDRLSLGAKLAHPVEAFLGEGGVTHGEHLVDQQDFRFDIDRDGEAQAHRHPGGVGLHRVVDERFDPGEVDDLVQAAADEVSPQAEQGTVQKDVLPTRVVRMETGSKLEQGGDATVH